MPIITTYDTLVQAIKEEAEDDGTEFASFLPAAIGLAEERLFKELDLPGLTTRIFGTLTTNVQTLAKPSGYEFATYFAVSDSVSKRILKKKTESFLVDYWPLVSDTGYPKYYADEDASSFILAPTPQTNYAYEVQYYAKPVKLSAGNQTNYYLNECVDVLFLACMCEMSKFMKAWEQSNKWESDYMRAAQGWNTQQIRYRRDGEMSVGNTDSTPNSLRHVQNTNA